MIGIHVLDSAPVTFISRAVVASSSSSSSRRHLPAVRMMMLIGSDAIRLSSVFRPIGQHESLSSRSASQWHQNFFERLNDCRSRPAC